MSRILGALTLLSLLTLLAPPAGAYVRTRTVDNGNPIYWNGGCVFMVPSTERAGGLAPFEIMGAFRAAASAWNEVSCSYIQLVVEDPQPGLEAGFSTGSTPENVIVFQDEIWPYDSSAAALTTITYLASNLPSSDGEIVDADIEVNAVDFRFTTTGGADRHDLQNVITHELGHVLGLDHTCDDGMISPTPVDNTGATIPSCFPPVSLPPEITEATMYNFAYPGEVSKRSLEPDDRAGLCAAYPIAEDPNVCEPVPPVASRPSCGCAARAATPGAALPLLLTLAALLLLWRRRHGTSL